MKKESKSSQDSPETKVLKLSAGEELLKSLKKMVYSIDKIGQAFVIHIPAPKRETHNTRTTGQSGR